MVEVRERLKVGRPCCSLSLSAALPAPQWATESRGRPGRSEGRPDGLRRAHTNTHIHTLTQNLPHYILDVWPNRLSQDDPHTNPKMAMIHLEDRFGQTKTNRNNT